MQIKAAFSSSSLSVIVGENYPLIPIVERVDIFVDINLVVDGADGFVFATLTLALASAFTFDCGVLLRRGYFGGIIFVHYCKVR
jgi:hypothetical protein